MLADINGQKIAYTDEGSGTILVLLHGWGVNKEYFSDFVKNLQTKGEYRIIRLDLPGFGSSPEPKEVWGVDEYVKTVNDFLVQLRLEKINILGHSFGGQIATKFSSLYPERVVNLILVGASVIRKAASKISTTSKPQNSFIKALKEIYIQIFGSKDYKQASAHMRDIMKKVISQDESNAAKHIQLPTLLAWGAKDTYTPINEGHELHHLIESSTLAVNQEATHSLPRTNADWLATRVHLFLEKNKSV